MPPPRSVWLLLGVALTLAGCAGTVARGAPQRGRLAARSARSSRSASMLSSRAPAARAADAPGGLGATDGGAVAEWRPNDIVVAEAAPGAAPASILPAQWFDGLLAAVPPLAPPAADALDAFRAAGAAEVRALVDAGGLPVSKSEAWRHVGVRELYARTFALVDGAAPVPLPAVLPDAYVADGAGAVAVFVDGAFCAALSRVSGLPGGVYVGGLADLDAPRREQLLAKLAVRIEGANANTLGVSDASVAGGLGGAPFCALNAAAAVDVAAMVIPAGVALADTEPIHLVFVSSASAPVSHPRYLLDGGAGSAITLVTSHVDACELAGAAEGAEGTGAAGASRALTNAVGQLLLSDGALVRHTLVAERGPLSSHVENVEVTCAAGARYELTTLQGPAFLCRINVGATLAGEGAQAHARGLMLTGGESSSALDLHTAIRHLTAGCESSQLQKNLLAQKGRAVFRGLIRANGLAKQTVAHQLCRSMLLSDGAKLDVAPCLEIIADDVECTHGATVAELDEEKVFYFRARGISAEAARYALVKGFALEVIDKVPYSGTKRRMAALALRLIPRKRREAIDTSNWSSI